MRRAFSLALVFGLASIAGALTPGCNYLPLPSELNVALAPGIARNAPVDSGPTALADSTWIVYVLEEAPTGTGAPGAIQSAGAAAPGDVGAAGFVPSGPWLARVVFGPDGRVRSIQANADEFPEAGGQTLIPDGVMRPTLVPGTTYVARCYGGEIDRSVGISALGQMFMGPIRAATANLYVYGELDGDVIRGTAGWSIEVSPEAQAAFGYISNSKEVPIHAVRVAGTRP